MTDIEFLAEIDKQIEESEREAYFEVMGAFMEGVRNGVSEIPKSNTSLTEFWNRWFADREIEIQEDPRLFLTIRTPIRGEG